MFPVSIKVLSNRLPEASLKLRQRSGQITQQSAQRIAAAAKSRAPVDTGRLQSEIEAIKAGAFDWNVVSPTPYAFFVHWGTIYMAPRPYLLQAGEAERGTFLDAFDQMLDNLL